MLTIKHIDSQGREYIRECESVKWVPDYGDAESFGNAGLYLDADPLNYPQSDEAFCIPVCRLASSSDHTRPCVFVMNKHGATIAKYML